MHAEAVPLHRVHRSFLRYLRDEKHGHYQYPVSLPNGTYKYASREVYDRAVAGYASKRGGNRKQKRCSSRRDNSEELEEEIEEIITPLEDIKPTVSETQTYNSNEIFEKYKDAPNSNAWYRTAAKETHDE